MNAQNSDSFSSEVSNPPKKAGETPSGEIKKHTGMHDILGGFWHKKSSEKLPEKENIAPVAASPEAAPAIAGIENAAAKSENPLPNPEKPHLSIADKISHIFHKKSSTQIIDKGVEVSETTESNPLSEKKESEMSYGMDERFTRLLEQDSTYHLMIRSEDIKNIQLQLSMRYMLVMLAIFVVIAWVVNNRVIMFGFSDFPLLARTRDALFALLTGLFSLTVWFGSVVWFRHKAGVVILRVLAGILFFVVLVSIYLPFWR